ncbi:MAG: hypothetical protein ALAOOOJD_00345 [bacterium]|nr:hypothetical protein [bacterium]
MALVFLIKPPDQFALLAEGGKLQMASGEMLNKVRGRQTRAQNLTFEKIERQK